MRLPWHVSVTPAGYLLALIIAFALLIRLGGYDNPLAYFGGEGFRDYLIAKHAVTFGELPITGPWNGAFPALGNSPLYYYLLIPFVAFSDTWHTLALGLILLQCGMIYAIYRIGRELFGIPTGLAAATIYAVSPSIIQNATMFVWQPWIMEPLLVFSALAGVVGYRSRRPAYLLASIVLCIFALACHLSTLAFLPLYGICMLVALYKTDSWRGIAAGLCTGALIFSAVFLIPRALAPEFNAEYSNPTYAAARTHVAFDHARLLFLRLSPVENPSLPAGAELLLMPIIAAAFAFYMFSARPREEKIALALLVGFVIQQILVVTFAGTPAQYRYLMPAYFCFTLVVCAIICGGLSRIPLRGAPLLPVLIIAILGLTAPTTQTSLGNIPAFERPRDVVARDAVSAITDVIDDIQSAERYADYSFFAVDGTRSSVYALNTDAVWAGLEAHYGRQLVSNRNNWIGFEVPGNAVYKFLICGNGDTGQPAVTLAACSESLAAAFPDYTLLKPVYVHEEYLVVLSVRADMIGT